MTKTVRQYVGRVVSLNEIVNKTAHNQSKNGHIAEEDGVPNFKGNILKTFATLHGQLSFGGLRLVAQVIFGWVSCPTIFTLPRRAAPGFVGQMVDSQHNMFRHFNREWGVFFLVQGGAKSECPEERAD